MTADYRPPPQASARAAAAVPAVDPSTLVPEPGTFLGDFARLSAQGQEAHPVAYLGAGLALLSAALAPHLLMEWTNRSHTLNHLWLMLVGHSAQSHRTTVKAAVTHALRVLGTYSGDIPVLDIDRKATDAGLVTRLDRSMSITEDDGSTTLQVPSAPESTVLVWNELKPLLDGDGPQDDNVRDLLLNVYDGSFGSTTLKTPVPTQPCCVTILGNITVSSFREVVARTEMIESGFVGRWLPIEVPVSGALVSMPSLHGEQDSDTLERHIAALAELRRLCDGREPVRVRGLFTDGYLAERDRWYHAEHPDAGSRWSSAPEHHRRALAPIFGRWQATQVRLAVLHAVSRQLGGLPGRGGLPALRVDTEDAVWAQAVLGAAMDALQRHLPEVAGKGVSRVEDMVLAELRTARIPLKRSDLNERVRNTDRDVSAEMVKRACASLLAAELVDTGTWQRPGSAGRPATMIVATEYRHVGDQMGVKWAAG